MTQTPRVFGKPAGDRRSQNHSPQLHRAAWKESAQLRLPDPAHVGIGGIIHEEVAPEDGSPWRGDAQHLPSHIPLCSATDHRREHDKLRDEIKTGIWKWQRGCIRNLDVHLTRAANPCKLDAAFQQIHPGNGVGAHTPLHELSQPMSSAATDIQDTDAMKGVLQFPEDREDMTLDRVQQKDLRRIVMAVVRLLGAVGVDSLDSSSFSIHGSRHDWAEA